MEQKHYGLTQIIPRHEVIALAVAVHKKHIQAAIRLKDYAEAQLQIEVAHSHYPSGFDWSVFTDHLIDVQIAEEEHLRAQKNYNDCHHRYSELKAKVNEFARKLQVTQERFADNDLDEPENWDGFFSELGNIVNKMVEEAKHSDENRRLFKDIDDSFRKAYPWLVEDAIGSLITAEFLFQVHADGSFIDYAPVVVGFAKSIEVQIKYVKGLSNDDKTTLGQLISMVRNQEDDSINERLGSINILRCKAAHVAVLNREDAEKMRRILYGIKGRKTKGLLLLFAD